MTAQERHAADEAPYTLRIGGRFRLDGPEGEVVVSSKKARAILVILALSPRQERQRPWLAETLWGRSGDEHARNSLRGELSRLAKLFPAEASPLRLDSQSVSLVPGAVAVERGDGEVLEGMRMPGEIGFDAWLRAARAASPPPSVAAVVHHASPFEEAAPFQSRHVVRVGLAPVVSPGSKPGPDGADAAGNLIVSRIGHCLQEVGGIELIELRGATLDAGSFAVPDIYLQCFARDGASGPEFAFSAVRASDKAVAWSHLCRGGEPDDPALVSDLAERILARISGNPRMFSSERHLAVVRALQGVERMFSLTADNLTAADRCFTEAAGLHESSSFHAYRAYLATFWPDAGTPVDRTDLVELARDEADAALRLDPSNGLTLSLLAHVHAFVLRDFERAQDLIQQAQAVGSTHVMTHDAEALLRVYAGNTGAARAFAMKTAMLGRFLPYRYAFVTTLCMTAALEGDYEAGIRHGRLALSLQPRRASRAYSPTLRYLGACLTQTGRLAEARGVFEELAEMEPHLSPRIIGTTDYPVPSEPAAVLIRDSLKRVGL
jgi:tetratricopeptide (TPR) repeat protein